MCRSKQSYFVIAVAGSLLGFASGAVARAADETATAGRDDAAAPQSLPAGQQGIVVTSSGAPFRISYRIIGTPIVGSPVTVELRVESTQGPGPVTLRYRINDASSMTLPPTQLASVELQPAADEGFVTQQVTVVPQREGRVYLNVDASVQTEEGSTSTLTAIPIQVSSGGRVPNGDGERPGNGDDDLATAASGG